MIRPFLFGLTLSYLAIDNILDGPFREFLATYFDLKAFGTKSLESFSCKSDKGTFWGPFYGLTPHFDPQNEFFRKKTFRHFSSFIVPHLHVKNLRNP